MTDKVKLTSRERAIECALFALEKKALNVKALEIGRLSSIADYLVLGSRNSARPWTWKGFGRGTG
jgi:ribosome-associated protein